MNKRKLIYGLAVLIIIGGVVWLAFGYFYPQYQFNKFIENYKKAEQDYMAMLKNDKYGGQTTEETYGLYVEALKKGDTDLASQYFYWERQAAEKQKLDDLKAKSELEKYVNDLPKWGELKREAYNVEGVEKYSYKVHEKEKIEELPDGKGGYIEKKWPEGDYKYNVEFWLNKQANIWKIYSI